MGFMDKLKGAMNAVTGGAAKVTIEWQPQQLRPGQPLSVKVVATSTGGEIKSKGCYVDLMAREEVRVPKGEMQNAQADVLVSKTTFDKELQIAPAFVLPAGGTMTFEGKVEIPSGLHGNFNGHYTKHTWTIRGRIEAFGNDPDSGYLPMTVS